MEYISNVIRKPFYQKKQKTHTQDAHAFKQIGRIHRAVCSPDGIKIVGFLIKQPDIAGMVARDDIFVAACAIQKTTQDGEEILYATSDKSNYDDMAKKQLGIDWDSCIIWTGMDVQTVSGKDLGYIDDIAFDAQGYITNVLVGDGTTSSALVGKIEIPDTLLLGYQNGHMLVKDQAAKLSLSGGVAQKAGESFSHTKETIKETSSSVAHAADSALCKGGRALGRAFGRTKNAFKAFKDEYKQAVKDE